MYDLVADHNDFTIIDKSPGVGFHREQHSQGLTAAVASRLSVKRLYPVHRLDKMTSGLLLFAKSRDVARQIADEFYSRSVEKYYIALSDRRPRKKQGLVAGDMDRTRRGMWKLVPRMSNPAVTQFFSSSMGNNLRMFILKPHTGKTHQLRVALKSIGSPVLGDPLYYRTSCSGDGADRCYLHSYALVFTLNDETFQFICHPRCGFLFGNESFREAFRKYEKPWTLPWPRMPFR
jgi:tRNA pseudouridine32 synthase/23S rRNA pseudouridine746 synthase